MKRTVLRMLATTLILGLGPATLGIAAAVGSDEKARIKASNLLGFASEELSAETPTSAKVRDLVSLVDETRDYFKVSGQLEKGRR